MGSLIIQNNFTHGQWDETLINRTDVQTYNSAAKVLRNVIVKPQGGVSRRFGTKFIANLGLTVDEVQLQGFEFSETSSYLLVFTDNLLTIYKDDVIDHTEVTTYSGSILANSELRFAQLAGPTGVLMVIVHEDHPPKNLFRNLTDTTWTFVDSIFDNFPGTDFNDLDYSSFNFTLSVTNSLQVGFMTSSAAAFSIDYEGGYFIGIGSGLTSFTGIAKLDTFVNPTQMNITILQTFDSNYSVAPGVKGRYVFLQKPSFSAAKGYPRTVAFYQSRLVFGGTRDLPQSIFMSWVNDFFNFNVFVGDPSNAIQISLGSSEIDKIQHIISDRSLQFFTLNSEFTIPQGLDDAITPENVSVVKQTARGTTSVPPRSFDDQTIFIEKYGKAISAFLFNSDVRAYEADQISIFASSLIRSPIDSSIFRGSPQENSRFYMVVNNDGTIAIFQSLKQEGVAAWSIINTGEETPDKFLRVTQVGPDIYFVIKRDIQTVTEYYLEKMDWTLLIDSTITFSFANEVTSVTGLDHLNDRIVSIIGDGFILEDQVVNTGSVQLSCPSKEITVGLKFLSEIETFPVNTGSAGYVPKRIPRVFVDVINSLGIKVNGTIIPYLNFGDATLTQPTPLQTEIFEYLNLEGWPARDTVKITQDAPLPFNVIGVGYEVEV